MTTQEEYLAGCQAALEKLAYDWLGDSGLSLGGLSEYKSTSDPAKVRELQRNLEALAKDRAKSIKDFPQPENDELYFAAKKPRYTGVDPVRKAISSFSPEGSISSGTEMLWRASRRIGRGKRKVFRGSSITPEEHIKKLKELKNSIGSKARWDLLDLEPQAGIGPVTASVLSNLTEDELIATGDSPYFIQHLKPLTSGVSADKREKEIENLVKKLKAIKSNKRNLNEEIESEKSRGYKTYLTPQNINRLAILGGTAGGAYLGDFTPRAFGVSLGGSVVGNLLGGAAGSGINAFRGGEQSNLVPLIGSTAGALGGGLAAGKYLS